MIAINFHGIFFLWYPQEKQRLNLGKHTNNLETGKLKRKHS